jgi:hypothetical protein
LYRLTSAKTNARMTRGAQASTLSETGTRTGSSVAFAHWTAKINQVVGITMRHRRNQSRRPPAAVITTVKFGPKQGVNLMSSFVWWRSIYDATPCNGMLKSNAADVKTAHDGAAPVCCLAMATCFYPMFLYRTTSLVAGSPVASRSLHIDRFSINSNKKKWLLLFQTACLYRHPATEKADG